MQLGLLNNWNQEIQHSPLSLSTPFHCISLHTDFIFTTKYIFPHGREYRCQVVPEFILRALNFLWFQAQNLREGTPRHNSNQVPTPEPTKYGLKGRVTVNQDDGCHITDGYSMITFWPSNQQIIKRQLTTRLDKSVQKHLLLTMMEYFASDQYLYQDNLDKIDKMYLKTA